MRIVSELVALTKAAVHTCLSPFSFTPGRLSRPIDVGIMDGRAYLAGLTRCVQYGKWRVSCRKPASEMNIRETSGKFCKNAGIWFIVLSVFSVPAWISGRWAKAANRRCVSSCPPACSKALRLSGYRLMTYPPSFSFLLKMNEVKVSRFYVYRF